MKDNICKHQMKILKMMHLTLKEGTITRYYGSMRGIMGGRLQMVLGSVGSAYNTTENAAPPHVPRLPHGKSPKRASNKKNGGFHFPVICFHNRGFLQE